MSKFIEYEHHGNVIRVNFFLQIFQILNPSLISGYIVGRPLPLCTILDMGSR